MDIVGIETIYFGAAPQDVVAQHGGRGLEVKSELEYTDFARMLAKIGYSFAVATVGEAVANECRAGMVTAARAAFAIDGLHAAIKDRIQTPENVTAAWKKNRTARPTQVLEVFKMGCDVGDHESELRHAIKTLFQFRDWSAHPPAEFREPVRPEDLQVGVPWQYVAFSASNARQLIEAAHDIAACCVWNPKLVWPDLVVWGKSKRKVVNELHVSAGF